MYTSSPLRSTLGGLLLLLLFAGGCSPDQPIGVNGPRAITFELQVPGNLPQADFHAISGLSVVNQKVIVGDSIIERPIPTFYAQFTAGAGIPLPATVQLNGVGFSRHLETDTLRLGSVLTNVDFSGLHTWTLADSGGTPQKFTIGGIVPIDSVTPFAQPTMIRADTTLRITWEPSGDASTRMMLIWTTKIDPHPYIQDLVDNSGSFVVPREVMLTLAGQGTVHLIRYRYISGTFRGRTLNLARIAQRTFDVVVNQ